jgi:hypothetical protein
MSPIDDMRVRTPRDLGAINRHSRRDGSSVQGESKRVRSSMAYTSPLAPSKGGHWLAVPRRCANLDSSAGPPALLSFMVFSLALGCGSQGATPSVVSDASMEGSEEGLAVEAEAAVPKGSPAVCALFPIAFPDAAATFLDGGESAPDTCAITAADVACEANTDCVRWSPLFPTGCITPVIGVNEGGADKASAPSCPRPLIPAPSGGGPDTCGPDSGLETQDCKLVPDPQHVAVTCVGGQCMASALL